MFIYIIVPQDRGWYQRAYAPPQVAHPQLSRRARRARKRACVGGFGLPAAAGAMLAGYGEWAIADAMKESALSNLSYPHAPRSSTPSQTRLPPPARAAYWRFQ